MEGDTYISSPYGFFHGVSYKENTWDNRMIAIQARFLLDREQLKTITQFALKFKNELGEIISNSLMGGFEFPTLDEVLFVNRSIIWDK